jgi:protein involved in polysaccharide export with SLBB domain
VVNPGVYTLDSESRITDALDAAAGITDKDILDGLNLALRVKG